MRQSSLLSYVDCTPPREELPKTFFDLPYKIRISIYVLSGIKRLTLYQSSANRLSDVFVLRRCPGYRIFRTFENGARFDSTNDTVFNSTDVLWEACRCYVHRGYGRSLLLTCKQVNYEVHQILYGDRTLPGQTAPGDGDYERLKSFSIPKLRSLKELSIHLNLYSHFGGTCCCRLCSPDRYTWRYRQTILERLDLASPRILNYHEREICAFGRMIKFLAAHITPGQLNFTLDLDTDCEFAAEEYLKTLLQLPRLKDCAIRFRKRRNARICRLIRWTVQNLTSVPASFIHFGALPIETKILILQQTALYPRVTHTWNSGWRTFGSSRCCTRCSRGHGKFNCFCSFRTAYSTWCQCWNIPHELFAVSKEMRHIAAEVFFASKRIHLAHKQPMVNHIPGLRTMFDVIPNDLLRYIRHLHVDISLDQYDARELTTLEELDAKFVLPWKTLIYLIWKHCDVGKMTITLDLTQRLRNMIQNRSYRASDQTSHEDDEKAWPLYSALVEAMKDALLGIQHLNNDAAVETTQNKPLVMPQNFYVHLSSPMHLRDSLTRYENERILEKIVMGPQYDSSIASGREKKTNFPQYQVLDYYCQGIEDAYWRKVNEIGAARSAEVYSDLALIADHIEGCEKCHGRPPKYSMAPRTGWEQQCTNKWEWWTLEDLWRKKAATPSDKGTYAITRYQELQLSLT